MFQALFWVLGQQNRFLPLGRLNVYVLQKMGSTITLGLKGNKQVPLRTPHLCITLPTPAIREDGVRKQI
jgi:hypothetical protein